MKKILKEVLAGAENRLRWITGASVWVDVEMESGAINRVLMTQHAVGLFRGQHEWVVK